MEQKPWQTEPDRVELEFEGYPCLVIRNPSVGNLCGYVGIPEGHPLFGEHYDIPDVEVHGGLTYGDEGMGEEHDHQPYYKPMRDKNGKRLYWYGFDCAHSGDYCPGTYESMLEHYTNLHLPQTNDHYLNARDLARQSQHVKMFEQKDYETYRDVAYVTSEIESLAKQLKALE